LTQLCHLLKIQLNLVSPFDGTLNDTFTDDDLEIPCRHSEDQVKEGLCQA